MSGIKKCILRLTENVISLCKEVNKPLPPPPPTDDEVGMLKLRYEFMLKVLERERERDKIVDGKASMFIGSTSIMGALLVGCFNYLKDSESDVVVFSLLCLGVLIFFLMRSITYSIHALRKRNYYYLAQNDIERADCPKSYYEGLIKSIETVLKHNEHNTNSKVDFMELAQRNFFNFWLSAFLCVALLLLYKFLREHIVFGVYMTPGMMPWLFAFIYGACIGFIVHSQLYPTKEEKNK